jgi:hypothetical protein
MADASTNVSEAMESVRPSPITTRYWLTPVAGLLATTLTLGSSIAAVQAQVIGVASNPVGITRVTPGGESLTSQWTHTGLLRDEPIWLSYVDRRLREMVGDADDSERARVSNSTPGRALLEARRLLPDEIVPPSVIPSDDGGVLLVWHKAGWDLEIAVEERETTAWARERVSGHYWAGSVSDRELDLKQLLALMTER